MNWKSRKNPALSVCPAAKNFEKLVRRITFIMMGIVLLMILCMAAVTGYAFYRINQAVTAVTNPDLSALEQLIAQKAIVLTREQKEKMWGVLNPDQIGKIRKWKEKTADEVGSAVTNGKNKVSEKIGEYKRQPNEKAESSVKKIYERWQNFAKNLTERGTLMRLEPN